MTNWGFLTESDDVSNVESRLEEALTRSRGKARRGLMERLAQAKVNRVMGKELSSMEARQASATETLWGFG